MFYLAISKYIMGLSIFMYVCFVIHTPPEFYDSPIVESITEFNVLFNVFSEIRLFVVEPPWNLSKFLHIKS